MNNLLFNELNEKNNNQIKRYLDSYFIEPEFFHCEKNDLISLEEYLLYLRKKKEEFDRAAKDIFSLVKQRNSQIISIEPYFNIGNDNLAILEPEQLIIASKYLNSWESFTKYNNSIESLPERNKEDIFVNDIKYELSQILDVASRFDYSREREGFITSSNNFIVNPLCFSFVEVLLQDKSVLARLQLLNNNYEVIDFDNAYLKRHTKDNVKRLYLTK